MMTREDKFKHIRSIQCPTIEAPPAPERRIGVILVISGSPYLAAAQRKHRMLDRAKYNTAPSANAPVRHGTGPDIAPRPTRRVPKERRQAGRGR
jgi:hypothetical protein